jgi:hypothetical protein
MGMFNEKTFLDPDSGFNTGHGPGFQRAYAEMTEVTMAGFRYPN